MFQILFVANSLGAMGSTWSEERERGRRRKERERYEGGRSEKLLFFSCRSSQRRFVGIGSLRFHQVVAPRDESTFEGVGGAFFS